jgi:uncharacterized SAM-binding protein YcdF (DUF218 family)
MIDLFIILICAAAFCGGVLVAFAEGMADTAGDASTVNAALVVSGIGLLGLLVEIVRGVIALLDVIAGWVA